MITDIYRLFCKSLLYHIHNQLWLMMRLETSKHVRKTEKRCVFKDKQHITNSISKT